MTMTRKGLIQFSGKDVTVVGPDILVGQTAPEFTAHAPDFSTVNALESTQGKVRIIGSLPSLNTSVCDRETRKFNEEAANLSSDIAIIMVSTDLPYAQRSWCAAAGIDRVITLSDHVDTMFGERYGVLMQEPRVLRRAIFVVDRHDQVVYAAYMPAIGVEPDYQQVLQAAKAAL
jgi:thiol peroxidase